MVQLYSSVKVPGQLLRSKPTTSEGLDHKRCNTTFPLEHKRHNTTTPLENKWRKNIVFNIGISSFLFQGGRSIKTFVFQAGSTIMSLELQGGSSATFPVLQPLDQPTTGTGTVRSKTATPLQLRTKKPSTKR